MLGEDGAEVADHRRDDVVVVEAEHRGVDRFLAEGAKAFALERGGAVADFAAGEELLEPVVGGAGEEHAAENAALLVVRERGALAGRAGHDHSVRAVVGQVAEQPDEGVLVDVAVRVERRHCGCDHAPNRHDRRLSQPFGTLEDPNRIGGHVSHGPPGLQPPDDGPEAWRRA